MNAWLRNQGEAAEERFENEIDSLEDALDAREDNYVAAAFDEPGISLPEIHVVLGLSTMLLGVLRVLWRGTTPLPPWSEHLSPGERTFEAWLEKVLLALLFAVPASGLAPRGATRTARGDRAARRARAQAHRGASAPSPQADAVRPLCSVTVRRIVD